MSQKYQLGAFGHYVDFSFSRQSAQERRRLQRSRNVYFEGQYGSWEEAESASLGYDSPMILERAILATRKVVRGEAAFERDTVTFDRQEVPHEVLCWLLYVAAMHNGHVSVLDFGGALGSVYHQVRQFFPYPDQLTWSVVEQEAFVLAGRAEFETDRLHFFHTPAECVAAQKPNFILLSGCLQYLATPHDTLAQLLSYDIPYFLINKTMARHGMDDVLSVQHVPENIYRASYPVWMLDSARLEDDFTTSGYAILDRFEASPGSSFGFDDQRHPYAGWFLRKRP